MRKETFLSLFTASFVAAPLFAAQAGGCCGSVMGSMPGCSAMSGLESPAAQPIAAANKLPQQVATVFDGYVRIQTALAKDSLEGVAENAQSISKTVKDDSSNTFSVTVARQSEALAKATDLPAARTAFKSLSDSLIEYTSMNPQVAGSYRQVHCSMANASWLQTDSVVNNPYTGKSMARCGEFVKNTTSDTHPQHDHSMHMH